jgi:DUF4097 and DUF4098 domain-containing protein YvlB
MTAETLATYYAEVKYSNCCVNQPNEHEEFDAADAAYATAQEMFSRHTSGKRRLDNLDFDTAEAELKNGATDCGDFIVRWGKL